MKWVQAAELCVLEHGGRQKTDGATGGARGNPSLAPAAQHLLACVSQMNSMLDSRSSSPSVKRRKNPVIGPSGRATQDTLRVEPRSCSCGTYLRPSPNRKGG